MRARHFALSIWILAAIVLTAGPIASQAGLCFNGTASMPVGAYWTSPRSRLTLSRGTIVQFTPPATSVFKMAIERHYFSSAEMLLKPVAAIPGDIIQVSAQGIERNGRLLPNSTPLAHDSAGRPLHSFAYGSYWVQPGTVWLISSYSPKSFDSRYFGPVAIRTIQNVAQPLLTWKNPE